MSPHHQVGMLGDVFDQAVIVFERSQGILILFNDKGSHGQPFSTKAFFILIELNPSGLCLLCPLEWLNR